MLRVYNTKVSVSREQVQFNFFISIMGTLSNRNTVVIMERRISKNSPAVLIERARIVCLWLGGASARSISQETGVSLSVVYRWIHRWQEEGTIKSRPYNRRLRKVRWSNDNGLTTTNVIHAASTPRKLPQLPQKIPLPQTALMPLNSTATKQPKASMENYYAFQHYHYLKMMQHYLFQPTWFISLPLH